MPEARTAGRKTKRTPEVEKAITDALRVGASRKDAAAAAGVSERTFYEWMGHFPQFSQAVTRAEGQCAARMTARIYQEATAERGDWKAALEWLKRRRRDEWGDSIDVRKLSDDELIARATAALRGVDTTGPDATGE
jgi:transposase